MSAATFVFFCFFLSLSACLSVSREMDVSCHAPLPLFLQPERCPPISKLNFLDVFSFHYFNPVVALQNGKPYSQIHG